MILLRGSAIYTMTKSSDIILPPSHNIKTQKEKKG